MAVVILIPVLLFLILYGLAWKLFIGIRNSSYAISTDSASLQFLSKRSLAAEENEKALQNIAADEERMKKTIFDNNRPLEFIEALENIARLSGSLIEITPVEGKDSLSTFLIAAEGDFPNLFKFLRLIEVMKYQVAVEEANFEKSSPTGGGVMKLNLTLKTGIGFGEALGTRD